MIVVRTSDPIKIVPLSKYHAVKAKRGNGVKFHAFFIIILFNNTNDTTNK
jgi:hypothetical protein